MSRFPFPSTFIGWYQVAYSDELGPRAVKPLRSFDRDLVLFRDDAGVARLFDAHCPHLGAHLGHGGCVEEGGLRCPFHGWVFDGSGACTKVPYADKVPPRAGLRTHPLVERHEMLFAWYHPDGKPPLWDPPALVGPDGAAFVPVVRRTWKIRTHIHEIGDNIVDGVHFVSVHGAKSYPETRVETDGAVLRATSRMQQRTPRGLADVTIHATAYALGLWQIRFSGIVDTVAIDASTPIDGETMELRLSFMVSSKASATSGVGAALIADVCRQVDQDIPIWENKIYRAEPMLAGGDGPIPAYRRWARQFYA